MDLVQWMRTRGGVVHRDDARRAGFTDYRMRRAREDGVIRRLRNGWIGLTGDDDPISRPAALGGRVACITAARLLGLWVLADDRLHVTVPRTARVPLQVGVRLHRSRPRVPVARGDRIESIVDILEHVAICLPFEAAIAVWDSAIRTGLVQPSALAAVRWRRRISRTLAAAATMLSDSGLESMVADRLRLWGVDVRQQVRLLGHRVDVLVGERLVVQIDGWEFHSTAADRDRDNRHDTALRLAGYHVIRIGYAEVVAGWDTIVEQLRLALAQHLHLA